ncbi:MAG: zinc ribbon domain-containing protein, partial [candidate division WOR-3 bacterium]
MPTYEYRCEKCLNEFEQFQRITDPPVKRCPRCRG